MMNKRIFNLKTLLGVAAISFAVFFSACNNGNDTENVEEAIDESIDQDSSITDDLNKAKQVFYSLPSPIETAMLMKRAGAKYNKEFLNSVDKKGTYTTTKSMALNLGVYSADLSFSSMFDQSQASIKYLSATKKLADELGILNTVDKSTMQRMESNVNNRDSLMEIISETFMNSNSFLKENDRADIASIILVGGWVEGLYVATKIAKSTNDNKELIERIVDQRLSLSTLINLLNEYNDNKIVASIIPDLNELKSVYDKIQVSSSKIEAVSDKDSKVTTLKTSTETSISPEVFDSLCEKVDILRNKIVK